MTSSHRLAENECLRIAFQLNLCTREFARLRQVSNRLFGEAIRRVLAANLNEAHALVDLLENTLSALRRVLTTYLDAEP